MRHFSTIMSILIKCPNIINLINWRFFNAKSSGVSIFKCWQWIKEKRTVHHEFKDQIGIGLALGLGIETGLILPRTESLLSWGYSVINRVDSRVTRNGCHTELRIT